MARGRGKSFFAPCPETPEPAARRRRGIPGAGSALLAAVGLVFVAFAGCSARDGVGRTSAAGADVVRISGSDTMLILTRRLAETYMRNHPGVSVYVWGGGTARGIEDLARGRVDVAAASRPLEPAEVQTMAEAFKSVGISFAVAKEALSIYVNPRNPVSDLTLEQVGKVFSGEIVNWKELGGADVPIRVLRRPFSSGTYLYLREHVLKGRSYAANAEVVSTTQGIVEKVEGDPTAIGYGGVAYGRQLHCRVDGVLPSDAAIRDGSYPITRYLFLVTTSKPTGEVQRFIDWVQSPGGQAEVRDAGFVALW